MRREKKIVWNSFEKYGVYPLLKKNSVHLKLAFETSSEPIVLFLFVPSTMFIRFFLSSRLPPQERVVLFISRESDYSKVGHWFGDNHYLSWCLQNYLWDGNIFTRKCLSNFRCFSSIFQIFSTHFHYLNMYTRIIKTISHHKD